MARKKVKLALIENDATRKSTFKKRKKGLVKKADELATLCDVDLCALIYSPYEPIPEIWPSSLAVQRLLARFRKMPIMESTRKMDTQETFLRQRIKKTLDQTKRAQRDNRETEIRHLMFQCLSGERAIIDLNITDLTDVNWLIDQTLKELNNHIENGLTRSESSSNGNNLSFYQQEEKPNIVTMMNMINAQSSNVDYWQHSNYLSHQIGDNSNYVNANLQISLENFVTSNNNDSNIENKVVINNNDNGAGLWSNGFFPWDQK